MKSITDKNKIEEVLSRGVANIYPDKESLAKVLVSGKRLRLYCGYDPTAPSLHIGHAITLRKLAQFQGLGHEVIMLIGDFTAMIGDPTDKSAARKKLTRQQVEANLKNYQKQASSVLKFTGANPAQIKFNSQWHDQLTFADLIEVAASFTVGQMMARDMFQKRMAQAKPIFLHEFLYPLAQAYDSLAMDVDLELGGNDQTFNMLCGRDLMASEFAGQRRKEKFVLTTKLLTDASGKKMGKTQGNIVNLDETPDNMYGKIMSWPDEMILPGFELCTDTSLDELVYIKKQLQAGKNNPRDFKMKLAFEIVKQFHSEIAAKIAQAQFIKRFQKKEIPDQIPEFQLAEDKMRIDEILVKAGLAKSKSSAKRLIEQKAVKVNNEIIDDFKKELTIPAKGLLIQKGKRFFVKVGK